MKIRPFFVTLNGFKLLQVWMKDLESDNNRRFKMGLLSTLKNLPLPSAESIRQLSKLVKSWKRKAEKEQCVVSEVVYDKKIMELAVVIQER